MSYGYGDYGGGYPPQQYPPQQPSYPYSPQPTGSWHGGAPQDQGGYPLQPTGSWHGGPQDQGGYPPQPTGSWHGGHDPYQQQQYASPHPPLQHQGSGGWGYPQATPYGQHSAYAA